MNAVRIILVILVIAAVIGCQRRAGDSDAEVLDTSEDDAVSEGATGNQTLTGPGGI